MKPLIVMALQQESQGAVDTLGCEMLYCGVGKVNATHQLTRRLVEASLQGRSYPYVLNLGSAGSGTFSKGSLVAADRFVQRDMDVTGLGFRWGETPFEDDPPIIELPRRFTQLPHGICGSGDSFLQGPPAMACDIVDMEAYALAKVCLRESIPFACVKYITDGADGSAHDDWQENLKHAGRAFAALLAGC